MSVRRIVAVLALAAAAYGQALLDDTAIGKLVKAGISEPIIVEMINQQSGNFRLSSDDMLALKKAGASDKILSAMLARKGAPPTTVNHATTPFELTLRDATPVRLGLSRDINFTNVKAADKVEFEILDDLRIDGMLVIGHGARAVANVTVAEPKSRFGKGGKFGMKLESVPLMNGDHTAIRMTPEGASGGSAGAAPSLLFTIAKDDTFPDGATFTVYVDGESHLNAARFLVDMAFTSNPPGALVTMYGAPVGRTPFTTKLAPGTYKAIFSQAGFVDLTENIIVGPGHSNAVNAMFESRP